MPVNIYMTILMKLFSCYYLKNINTNNKYLITKSRILIKIQETKKKEKERNRLHRLGHLHRRDDEYIPKMHGMEARTEETEG